jgi:DNA polymerase-4
VTRKIIHVHTDAFYASIEQRDSPALKGKAVIVGGQPGSRGVVAACSYEARKFGIHSAMPSATAHRLCPKAIFLKPRFDVYRSVSSEIQAIFKSFTEKVEPLSLDEAYLDVSDYQDQGITATEIAKLIKQMIKGKTHLTASAGVSYNKFLAKIASDMDKPDGIYVIRPHQGPEFVRTLPIGKFHGIGKATEARMQALGIMNGDDLRQHTLEDLTRHFGKVASYYFNIARGIDNREVNANRIRKSLGSETTFTQDLEDRQEMISELNRLAELVFDSLVTKQLSAKTMTVKVKYGDFQQVTRSFSLPDSCLDKELMLRTIPMLLDKTEVHERSVRLLGVSASNFLDDSGSGSEQISLI